MKKNISINISGIIFHIEEEGYEKLQSYLTEINAYFKKYDDYSEIISDIENRIAEIFSTKLNKENEVISLQDVEQLITTMGNVTDFESVEEDDDFESASAQSDQPTAPKRLYRDLKRKIIGGVCSGIANYYKVDPLWSRVIFLILLFGFVIIPPASGLALILYIALWIALPGNNDLEEDKRINKLYRNPDDKVIGGVASGLAAYFNVDVAIVRLVFVLSVLFFGTGVMIYLVLWFIAPQAETMTEKMQMKGDPVTLSNIETSVKRSLQSNPDSKENGIVTALLFPFRLIGKIFEVLGKALGPLLEVLGKLIRIVFGLFLIFFSFVGVISMILAFAALLGLTVNSEIWLNGLPVDILTNTVPTYAAVATILAFIIPLLSLGFLGIRFITLRSTVPTTLAWSLLGVWVISVIISLSALPAFIMDFSKSTEIVEEEFYDIGNKTLVLNVNDLDINSYENVHLTIRPNDGNEIKLVKEFSADGNSTANAKENAKMVTYSVVRDDSVLTFDSDLIFTNDAKLRNQELKMTLYVPLDQKFVMAENIEEIISRTLYFYDYRVEDLGNVFIFENKEDLNCITCDPRSENGNYSGSNSDFTKVFDVPAEMAEITIKGVFKVNLKQDSLSRVEVIGRKSKVEDVEYTYNLNTKELEITTEDYDDDFNMRGRSAVYINISSPQFESIELFGNNDLLAENLKLDNFKIHMAGFSDADITGDFNSLRVDFEGLADVNISGTAENFEAKLAGKTDLDARDLITQDSDIKAYGKSDAVVSVTNYLTAHAAGISEIKYYGNPKKVDEKTEGLSSILGR